MSRYESILGTVGHTPVVRITKLAPKHVRLFVPEGALPIDYAI